MDHIERAKDEWFAACRCGMSFTYSTVENGQARNVRIIRYGRFFQEEVARLFAAGRSVLEIAELTGAPCRSIWAWLSKQNTSKRGLSKEDVEDIERQFRDALRQHGELKLLAMNDVALYHRVLRYAPHLLPRGAAVGRSLNKK
ncbi:hypothetical protein WN982_40035 [Paraburkholderia sp. IMGN_8]|uniref:hypothetical protein n=1 Tax=Paraburkholderia sp. IMGN_8 TaxID=3136564 RepID=UPI003100C2AA